MSRTEDKDQFFYYYFIGDGCEVAFAILFVVTGVGSDLAIFIGRVTRYCTAIR